MPEKFAYNYSFKFVMDEAGQPFYCETPAFSFMQAYRWALQQLRKAKKTQARKYKLETMDRYYG